MINYIGFQLCWFGLVFIGNSFSPIALLLLVTHLLFLSEKKGELALVISVMVIGSFVDYLLVLSGVFVFEASEFIPFWLITLWACFTATIYHSLSFLKKSLIVQVFTGAVIAPLSYLAGHKFGAVGFNESLTMTYLILAVIWSALLVIIFKLANTFSREE